MVKKPELLNGNPTGNDDRTNADSQGTNPSGAETPIAGQLRVYEAGELTVVGFGGVDVPSDVWVGGYREELERLIKQHGTKELAFDLTGVTLMPSGILGLMASLRQLGVEIYAYNPSRDVRETLAVTKLDQLIHVRDVEF